MKTQTYILDTNVLLSDPNALYCFGKSNLILPIMVLEELDRQKNKPDEVGRNAREVTRKLTKLTQELKDFRLGIPLGNDLGILYIYSINDFSEEYRNNLPIELSKSSGDNLILDVCLGLHKQTVKNHEFVFVSKDILARLKAQSLGLMTQDYHKSYDANSGITDGLYNGIAEITDNFNLENFYKKGKVELPEEIANSLFPHQCLVVSNDNGSALMRYIGGPTKEAKKIIEYSPCKLEARSKEQKFAIDLLLDPSVHLVTLAGKSGSGKTICALAAGLYQVSDIKRYRSLVIARPVQPMGKDIGYLPGSKAEKLDPWMAPIKDNLRTLIFKDGRKSKETEEGIKYLFDNGTIEIEALTYIRGRSIPNSFIIIDEIQNISAHELKTILTRVGTDSKIVLTGDISQIDVPTLDSLNNGLTVAIEKFKDQQIAGHITFQKSERSILAGIAGEIL